MDFEEILNALEDLVENSWTLPMSGGRTVVDSAQILEFVKEMRLNLPEEIKRSKRIIKERDEIIARARTESEGIITAANVQAKHLNAYTYDRKQSILFCNRALFPLRKPFQLHG